eukprot:m.20141 g.20141  ORF g.20141 m.20141 type:complete len:157 (+) comp8636_c0_seq1:158-628(+)
MFSLGRRRALLSLLCVLALVVLALLPLPSQAAAGSRRRLLADSNSNNATAEATRCPCSEFHSLSRLVARTVYASCHTSKVEDFVELIFYANGERLHFRTETVLDGTCHWNGIQATFTLGTAGESRLATAAQVQDCSSLIRQAASITNHACTELDYA